MSGNPSQPAVTQGEQFDHSSDANFTAYYEQQSTSEQTLTRFRTVRDKTLDLLRAHGKSTHQLTVVDIGCGAGTQSRLWAQLGHEVCALDVNEPLVEVARKRAVADGLSIRFDVGTATKLPYADRSKDVCLLPELLEHVQDWSGCLDEAVRVLKPGGVLYLSTTNALCPVQEEFDLPMYSWYPAFLKRRYERLSITTRPELVNHTRYPAVHWFTFYSLARYLSRQNMRSLDRFDMIQTDGRPAAQRLLVQAMRSIAPLRFLGHVLTSHTVVFALKQG